MNNRVISRRPEQQQAQEMQEAENQAMHIRSAIRRLRHDLVATPLTAYPRLFFPLVRAYAFLTGRTEIAAPVGKKTEIVIEGYPRCANTFAAKAFSMAQNRPVRMAHHLHSPSQIIVASRHNIPTLVLIRAPRKAVESYLVRNPHLTARSALKEYLSFYETIRPYRKHFVVATFKQVTSNYTSVMRRVNETFHTSFLLFEHTDENTRKCFEQIEAMDQQETKGKEIREEAVCRPSIARDKLKESVAEQLDKPELLELLTRATDVYGEYCRYADETPVQKITPEAPHNA